MIDVLNFQVCVNLDKQREKRKLAQNWKRKKHEEKKREPLSSCLSLLHLQSGVSIGLIDFQIFEKMLVLDGSR